MDEELAFASASELRHIIASKEVSPVEVTELYLRRIERLDPDYNSFLTVAHDDAIRSAKIAEDAVVRGDVLGPLHGLPISIKDLEMTKGLRTTGGSLIYRNRVPEADSIVVERVRNAGAVILGKTNTSEFGVLGAVDNRLGDYGRNPWNTEYTTGGSSGGAGAAIAAGLCSLATGSDGGGSIRIPCSYCGIYGIKPTQGRIPRYSGMAAPLVANQFSQSGPMTRTVRDSALLLQVLAGYDPRDPTSARDTPDDFVAAVDEDIEGLRIAWSPDYGYASVDPEVVQTTSNAALVFEDLGCSVDETNLALDDAPFDPFWTLFTANAYVTYGQLLRENRDQLTRYTQKALEQGSKVTGADYGKALGYMDHMKWRFTDLFDHYDLLISPTVATTAFPVGEFPGQIGGREVPSLWAFSPFTHTTNMIGHPAASIPCGFSQDGMPIGLHIVGRKGHEATVIAASAAFERARPWIGHRPSQS